MFVDGASGQRMLSISSRSGKRAFARVQLPITVEIGGCRWRVHDWSVGGFGIRDGGPKAEVDEILRAILHLGFSGFDVALDVAARVAWTAGGGACGFQFLNLTEDKARVLDCVSESWLRGELGTFDRLVEQGRSIPELAFSDGSAKPLRQVGKLARMMILLVLGIGVLGAGGFYLGAAMLTVHSDFAAVASDLTQIRAAEGGYMVASKLTTGSLAKRGDPVASLVPAVSPQTLLWYDTQINVLQTQLDQLQASLLATRAGFANFHQASKGELQSARSAREALEGQIIAEQHVYAQVASLARDGVLAGAMAEQEHIKLMALEQQLAGAKASETLARQHLNDAENGLFPSDGRSTQKSPADIEHVIADIKAQIAQLRDSKMATVKPMVIESPCDCAVMKIEANAGEFVPAGAPIVSLAQGGRNSTEVDALVLSDHIALVHQGQAAKVYLANQSSPVAGHVVAINYDPGNTGRIGLPDTLRTLNNYGLVTVALDSPGRSVQPTGVPATVSFRIDPWLVIASRTGMTWSAKNATTEKNATSDQLAAQAPAPPNKALP